MNRRETITLIGNSLLFLGFNSFPFTISAQSGLPSEFAQRLSPVGRRLETRDYYVWGTSPILDADGRVHVFYSRWPSIYGMGGWIHQSEIAHAVADSPESDFHFVSTVLSPKNGNYWDATTCHNPHIKEFDGKYYLYYMGNSNKKTDTKRIGVAVADSLYGPWVRSEHPLLLPAEDTNAWDDHCTTNPSVVQHPNGQFWFFYKSWNTFEYENYTDPKIRGNRKYGLATSDSPEGPFQKYEHNPIIDYFGFGNNIQVEDGYVWFQDGKFRMLLRDMGFFNHQYGLYIESADGFSWSSPKIAYYNTDHYFEQPPKPKHLSKYGRFERPQLLFQNGHPTHLFVASQGGKYQTSSAYVFKIQQA